MSSYWNWISSHDDVKGKIHWISLHVSHSITNIALLQFLPTNLFKVFFFVKNESKALYNNSPQGKFEYLVAEEINLLLQFPSFYLQIQSCDTFSQDSGATSERSQIPSSVEAFPIQEVFFMSAFGWRKFLLKRNHSREIKTQILVVCSASLTMRRFCVKANFY